MLLLIAAALGGQDRLDGTRLDLPAGRVTTVLMIGPHGGTCTAAAPVELAGGIGFDGAPEGGLQVAVVARSLRGSAEDDWQTTQVIAGRRHDPVLAFHDGALGSGAERSSWGIAGGDGAWENVSMQWDGMLRIPEDGVDLALTAVPHGSGRVWVDLDGDGVPSANEWSDHGGSTGRGPGGMTVVHQGLRSGTYGLRIQYAQDGRSRGVSLLWHRPGQSWAPVPAAGFTSSASLAIAGPVTVSSVVGGNGRLRLGEGVQLSVAPTVEELAVAGTVTLGADLDLTGVRVHIESQGRLVLAGHHLQLRHLGGSGTIDVAGGVVNLPDGDQARDLAVEGSGAVVIAGTANVRALAQHLTIAGGSLAASGHSVVHVALRAPLTTVVPLCVGLSGPLAYELTVDVPTEAPPDLGLGAWRADRQGRWFQRILPERLGPGRHHLVIDLGDDAPLVPEGNRARWSAETAAETDHGGLLLFTQTPSQAVIVIDATRRAALAPTARDHALTDLSCDGSTAQTGRRWRVTLRPDPYPADPYDPACFSLDLAVTAPDGTITRFAGFHNEPVMAVDRGDREETVTTGAARFEVRFRPQRPGLHHLRLTAQWAGQPPLVANLPDVQASGAPWDDIACVDAGDPRFFSAGGAFVWPAGCSLNSTYDTRSHGALGTALTPDRGSFSRDAYLERLAAGGASGCEVWLSPWNLGLEWNPDWPGYRGAGRYHPGHAAALDRLLDRAEQLHMRVNVSLFNHGMARDGNGAEDDWRHHPYARDSGGWLASPAGLFTDARAFAYQSRLFRYLAARYGDSPALLGWKLWAEVNLAHAPLDAVIDWHARASAALSAADPWHHPVTSHWCGDWDSAERRTAALPGIGYLTIDAYKGDAISIEDLLCASTRDPMRPQLGLAGLGKPVLVTEFGGSTGGTSRARMAVEHAIGPWAALVSGHAGAPMLWWFEWIDQENRFGVYGAVNRFLAGEDLRGQEAQCVALAASGPADLWCRAWSRPGRLLGYVLDVGWSLGQAEHDLTGTAIVVASAATPGPMAIAWWDADHGTEIERQSFLHSGGQLVLHPPPFRRHLGFKLLRQPADGVNQPPLKDSEAGR
jgi:hypothetical protein